MDEKDASMQQKMIHNPNYIIGKKRKLMDSKHMSNVLCDVETLRISYVMFN